MEIGNVLKRQEKRPNNRKQPKASNGSSKKSEKIPNRVACFS